MFQIFLNFEFVDMVSHFTLNYKWYCVVTLLENNVTRDFSLHLIQSKLSWQDTFRYTASLYWICISNGKSFGVFPNTIHTQCLQFGRLWLYKEKILKRLFVIHVGSKFTTERSSAGHVKSSRAKPNPGVQCAKDKCLTQLPFPCKKISRYYINTNVNTYCL